MDIHPAPLLELQAERLSTQENIYPLLHMSSPVRVSEKTKPSLLIQEAFSLLLLLSMSCDMLFFFEKAAE
jgi:hypothetical protein